MLKYRKIKFEDKSECEKIFYQSFPTEKKKFNMYFSGMIKYFRNYGLYKNDRLIGICSWVFSEKLGDTYITLCNLCVDKEYRKLGYGRRLVNYTLSQIKKSKIKKDVYITTNKMRYFKKLKFEVVTSLGKLHENKQSYLMRHIE